MESKHCDLKLTQKLFMTCNKMFCEIQLKRMKQKWLLFDIKDILQLLNISFKWNIQLVPFHLWIIVIHVPKAQCGFYSNLA